MLGGGQFTNKLKKTLPVILLLFLITIVLGITYAITTYTRTSSINTITTGNISMSYTESTNVISLNNELPKSDNEGKVSSEYFDFSVTTNTEVEENYPNLITSYEINIEPLSVDSGYTALTDSQIKVYLENKDTSSVLVDSKLISSLSASEANTNNKVLYTNTHTHSSEVDSITTNYRLRAWIDYNVDASSWTSSNKYEYKFRININGLSEFIKTYCFAYTIDETTNEATITDFYCGKGNNNGYEEITDVVIPKTLEGYDVTTIGEEAFYSQYLTSVDIPNSVTTIGEKAFRSNNLTSVTIPDSVTTIGNSAFAYNDLTSITIPDSDTSIGYSVFANNNLTSVIIPNSVTTIESSTFYNNNLTSVDIPNSVTTIGNSAFANNNLTSVDIPNSVTTIEIYAFANNNLTSVIIPNSVTSIAERAFENNNLTSVTIPDSVRFITKRAFYNNNLTSVTIPDSVININEAAFSNNNLTSVIIPNSVTYIGPSAFANNNLTSVTIPDSVIGIENYAFQYNNLSYVVLGENSEVAGIGWYQFSSSNRTATRTLSDGTTITYVDNPNLTVIYNNSGKARRWIGAVNGSDTTTTFVTGTVPSYTDDSGNIFNEVQVVEGYPE